MAPRYESCLLVIPFGGETDLTVVFREDKTGNVLHATSGDCSASIPFANGRIAAIRHPQSGDWRVQIPPTNIKTLYGTLYGAAIGNVDKDTVPESPKGMAFRVDVKTGATFSDLLPTLNGRVRVE
jgi:hypothetical protein